jgi:hypothetical protein
VLELVKSFVTGLTPVKRLTGVLVIAGAGGEANEAEGIEAVRIDIPIETTR